MHIILLGLPGAGKGTYAKMLSRDYEMVHLSSGNLFKNEIRKNTSLGRNVRDFVSSGKLVPDNITIEFMQEKITELKNEKIIFDGFPRTIDQAQDLSGIIYKIENNINLCIYIDVKEEILIKRLSGRRICIVDGSIYHLEFSPPKIEGKCDECGSPLYQREDDKPEVIKKRIQDNREKTMRLVDYYNNNEQILQTVNGSNREINDIYSDITNLYKEEIGNIQHEVL